MNNKEVVYILSAELNTSSKAVNVASTKSLEHLLTSLKIPHGPIIGSYNGTEEHSYLIMGEKYEALVKVLSAQYKQESYLKVDENRVATLIYSKGPETKLGQFVEISELEAESIPNWSYSPVLNSYFTTKAV